MKIKKWNKVTQVWKLYVNETDSLPCGAGLFLADVFFCFTMVGWGMSTDSKTSMSFSRFTATFVSFEPTRQNHNEW